MDQPNVVTKPREPWNKGKLVGQKAPFKLKDIWTIRIRLHLANCARDLALFDLAIDNKLRACDLAAQLQHSQFFLSPDRTREFEALSQPICRK